MLNFNIQLIRQMRGAPLTVLVAMLMLERSGQVPVDPEDGWRYASGRYADYVEY